MYYIKGFKVETVEQARVLLMMAMLKGDMEGASFAQWVIVKLTNK
jgi:hypothetical protein